MGAAALFVGGTMTTMTTRLRLVSFLLAVLFTWSVRGGFIYESSYSVEQLGSTDYMLDGGPVPTDLKEQRTTPISTYTFDVRTVPTSPTELKAAVGFTVDIDQRGSTGVSWNSVKVNATAKSSFVDTVIVEGVPNGSSGVVHLTWAVSGFSDILLERKEASAIFVRDVSTVGLLTSSVPSNVPSLFVNDPADDVAVGSQNPKIESHVPETTGLQSFVIDWSAGSQFLIDFDLTIDASMEVLNIDAAGFTADVEADFSNTATLAFLEFFDDEGNEIPGATLVGEGDFLYVADPTAVPEPSPPLLWSLMMVLLGGHHWRRKRAINEPPCL